MMVVKPKYVGTFYCKFLCRLGHSFRAV